MKVLFPLRTGRGLNSREHHMARARRVRDERWTVVHAIGRQEAPAGPVVVTLWRVSPSAKGLDKDNLQGALKAVRDQVADWLKRDDADPSIEWRYAQRGGKRGEWLIGIDVEVCQ